MAWVRKTYRISPAHAAVVVDLIGYANGEE